MIQVSFVLPAWNEAGELPATLAAIRGAMAGRPESWEVVVADNASTDATAEVAAREGARVVPEPFRQIAAARNAGARAAAGRFLIFVDADTRPSRELVHRTLDALATGRVVGGGGLLRLEGRGVIGRAGVAPWNWISRTFGLAAGSYLFCLRDAWEAVGGFDRRLYASEEIPFSRAVKRWGRERGLRFEVFPDLSAETSGRKLDGRWGPSRVALQFLMLFLCPWLVRSRRACFLWYRR